MTFDLATRDAQWLVNNMIRSAAKVRSLSILGIRGIPARHGGFETFAEQLSLYLLEKGWTVTVYCQLDEFAAASVTEWRGITLVNIPVPGSGAISTVLFDLISTIIALGRGDRNVLTLGYNTAVFGLALRVAGRRNTINMDGLEWKRDKWGPFAKAWLWLNERIGCLVGNRLIADHPEIATHLQTRVSGQKIQMIPYGSPAIEAADISVLDRFELANDRYFLIVARPEPENSILEMVRAFSRSKRGLKLVVLGNYFVERNSYHESVKRAASDEVMFLGAIYDPVAVVSLRFYARAYLHGHRVGGTNPSLVEALGAGSAVIAHKNRFNSWVAGDAGVYFSDEEDCSRLIDILSNDMGLVRRLRLAASLRHRSHFTWEAVLGQYERCLEN